MSTVMEQNFSGTVGASFVNTGAYSIVVGAAPTYQNSANASAKALRFPPAAQAIIGESFTGTTSRFYSRIFKVSGTPLSDGTVFQVRSGVAGPGVVFTASGKIKMLRTDQTSGGTSVAALPINTEFRILFSHVGTALTLKMFADTSTTTPLETISATDTSLTTATSARDGMLIAAGLGAGISMDISWPKDDDAADPGPRVYTPPVVLADDFAELVAAGYTGSLVEMQRQNLLALLSLSEPQVNDLNGLKIAYLRGLGYTGSIADMKQQGSISMLF